MIVEIPMVKLEDALLIRRKISVEGRHATILEVFGVGVVPTFDPDWVLVPGITEYPNFANFLLAETQRKIPGWIRVTTIPGINLPEDLDDDSYESLGELQSLYASKKETIPEEQKILEVSPSPSISIQGGKKVDIEELAKYKYYINGFDAIRVPRVAHQLCDVLIKAETVAEALRTAIIEKIQESKTYVIDDRWRYGGFELKQQLQCVSGSGTLQPLLIESSYKVGRKQIKSTQVRMVEVFKLEKKGWTYKIYEESNVIPSFNGTYKECAKQVDKFIQSILTKLENTPTVVCDKCEGRGLVRS